MQKLKMYFRWLTNYLMARIVCFSTTAPSPRSLSIETTEKCNLNCVMCPRKQTTLSGNEFTVGQFEHVLSLYPRINSVILLGRGETFMMKDIFPILDTGTRKGIQFTIISNGTLLDAETIKMIPDIGKMLVSIDHPHPDKYKEIRRGGNLEKVTANLKLFKKIKPHQWLCIQTVIMNSNMDSLDDMVKLAKDVSADAVKLILPVVFDPGSENIYINSMDAAAEVLRKAQKAAKKAGIRFVAVPLMKKNRVCVEPWLGVRVSLNGDIYPCCYIDNSAESAWSECYKGVSLQIPQSKYIMGNIYDKSAGQIWNGGKFRALRRVVRDTSSRGLLTDSCLNSLRSKVDVTKGFSYCSVCLYRNNRAC